MALKLFNTLSRSIQEFMPLDSAGKKVGMYCCGPTVYDFAHIGNWRTFVFGDLVRRYLEFKGYTVTHVMNITDVEAKIIKRVSETGMSREEYTKKYETEFFKDFDILSCKRPTQIPHATDYIEKIKSLIKKLLARGIAYQAADGSVYFSIEKYQAAGGRYGQLVKLNPDELRVGERVKSDEYAKESIADFALWKARVPEDGDNSWSSPWGEGRPGWHIECSAMSMEILGPSFDLHLGGEDLIFPHHEDEIAQSEGATGQPFVKHWLHGAHLLVEGKKMSKSLGNFFTLRDLLAKGFTGREIRYLLLTAHYRETFNFTLEGLQGAKAALARIKECLEKVLEIPEDAFQTTTVPPFTNTSAADAAVLKSFSSALDDDLNISKAWGVVFTWIRELNRKISQNKLSIAEANFAWATWKELDRVLGLNIEIKTHPRVVEDKSHIATLHGGRVFSRLGGGDVPTEVRDIDMQRLAAKAAKDFKRADALRDEIKSRGYLVEDTPKGTKFKEIKH